MEDIVLPSLENLSTSSMLKTHSHIYSPDFCCYILAKSCLLVCVHACIHSCMYTFSFLVWLCNWPLEISNYKSVGNEDFQGRRMRRSRFPLQRNCLCLGHYMHGIHKRQGHPHQIVQEGLLQLARECSVKLGNLEYSESPDPSRMSHSNC